MPHLRSVVRDNGLGIDPRCLHNVFNLFDNSTRSEGSWLGLVLVKWIVELQIPK